MKNEKYELDYVNEEENEDSDKSDKTKVDIVTVQSLPESIVSQCLNLLLESSGITAELKSLASIAKKYDKASDFIDRMLSGKGNRVLSGVEKSFLIYDENIMKKAESIKYLKFEPVKGKPVNVGKGIEAFVFKGESGDIVVSEKNSGLQMAAGKTEKEAVSLAIKRIKIMGISKVKKAIADGVERADKFSINQKPSGYFTTKTTPRNEWFKEINADLEKRGLPIIQGDRMELIMSKPSINIFKLDDDMSAYLKTHTDVLKNFHRKVNGE